MTQGTTPQHGRLASVAGRPAWLVPVAVGVGVLVVIGVVVAFILANRAAPVAAPIPATSTIQLLSPEPTVAPVPRATTTAFTALLPESVLQYALVTSVPDEEWVDADAIEAWSETYTDGASGSLVVRAGQWGTPDEATTFAATLVAALPTAAPGPAPTEDATSTATALPVAPGLPRTGDVIAAGAVVGTYTVVDAGDGTGVAVWTNSTSVFMLTAPVEDAMDAYSAYPL